MTNLEDQVLSVFNTVCKKEQQQVFSLSTSIESLNLDSLEILDLLMQLEQTFKFSIGVEELALCASIDDVCQLMKKNHESTTG